MIKDITNEISSAFSHSSLWDRSQFLTCLNKLVDAIPGGIEDWDEYAGENWGRVLVQKESVITDCVICLYRNAPLVFVQEQFQDTVAQYSNCHCILFYNVDEEIYSLDGFFFEQWSKGRSKTGELKNNSLSVSDIYWATVLG